MKQKLVYLLESGTGLIKIGCSKDPWTRCQTLRMGAPFPLTLIAQWPGSHPEERALHKQFAAYHEHGEWFRCEGAFADFVAQRRGLNMDPADTPSWAREQPIPIEERRQHFVQRQERLRALQQGEAA